MDVLKILSRGTKKTANQSATTVPTTTPANPQLYHDPTRGVKRKRVEETPLERSIDGGADDIDFFAPSQTSKPALSATNEDNDIVPKGTGPSLLDEDEVRQILRSHRIKFTLFAKHDAKSKVKKSKSKEKPKVKAKDLPLFPQPLTSFNQLRSTYNVSPRLVENLSKQGYRTPTEIQLGSLPLLLHPEVAIRGNSTAESEFEMDNGVNFLGVAPTGSGKTLAFLIPIINAIMKRRAESENVEHVLESIVLAPTRELAHQICNEGKKLAASTGVKIVGFKKGMRIAGAEPEAYEEMDSGAGQEVDDEEEDEEESDVSEGEDRSHKKRSKPQPATKTNILITTPLLLLNFLTKSTKSKRTLPTVRSLILDEGDVLLDPLFRDQTLAIWSACTNNALRLTCWSATMGSNIESLVMEQLALSNDGSTNTPLVRLVVGLKDSAVPSVNHRLIYTGDNEQGKLFTLRQLLHPKSSSVVPDMRLPLLVFVQTIDRAVSLHEELKFDFPADAGGSSRIAALHSSLSETARSGIIAQFRAGEIWILITTDLLMRGIDFRGVNGVINYDMPTSAAAYVHRVGRTGRAGREGGVAVTFYTKEDIPYLKSIANVISISERQAGKSSDEVVPKWLMDALPKVRKDDKKKLKKHGVESRRGSKAQITSKSSWERRKENNRRDAIAGSKKRRVGKRDANSDDGQESEWGGIDD